MRDKTEGVCSPEMLIGAEPMRLTRPIWAPGHAPIEWSFDPGADDEQVREENSGSDDLKGWFPLELRWRTWRLWPRRSDQWVLDLSPDTMKLAHSVSGRNDVVREIARSEAGELVIETFQYRRNRWLAMAAGRSVDGQTDFVLSEHYVSSGGLMGQFQRVSVGRAVVSWWPLNSRSRDGLMAFERIASYWNPSGLSVGPRALDQDEYWDSRLGRGVPPNS